MGVGSLIRSCLYQDWQGPVLDALATWLTEDFHRMVGQLTERGSVQKFVTLFKSHQHAGGSDSLARLLEPFLKILKQSSQLTVHPFASCVTLGFGAFRLLCHTSIFTEVGSVCCL